MKSEALSDYLALSLMTHYYIGYLLLTLFNIPSEIVNVFNDINVSWHVSMAMAIQCNGGGSRRNSQYQPASAVIFSIAKQ